MEYLAFKQYLGKIFGVTEVTEDQDIFVTLDSRFISRRDSENLSFTIANDELKELFLKVTAASFNGLEYFTNNTYEIAVDQDWYRYHPSFHRADFPVVAEDTANHIKYPLGFPSIEYCTFLITQIIEIQPVLVPRFRHALDFVSSRDINEQPTFQTVLPQIIHELTLKIETQSPTSYDSFRNYKTSFSFQFMYRSNLSLVEYSHISEMFHLTRTPRERYNFTQLSTPPLRQYLADVVDYYKLALSSDEPYIKYISFYHIMEYFYDEVFKKKMVSDLRNKITSPDFTYKNDDKVYEIAKFVNNRMRMDSKSGLGDEAESLKFVLMEYVPIEELRARIGTIDSTAETYYQTSKVVFCNAPSIAWSDVQGVYTQLCKRIYATRNSLIHSKSGRKHELYHPYKDEPILRKEIPLVKAVAELIIINSSSVL